MSNCLFCNVKLSKKNRAKEHIFPVHLQKKLGVPSDVLNNAHSKIVSDDFSGGHISMLEVERTPVFDKFKAGHICNTCNNGWMAKMEGEIKSILYSLIDGEMVLTGLNAREKQMLSSWTFKTCAVLSRSVGAPQNYVPDQHFKDFHQEKKIVPEYTSVFGGRCECHQILWSLSPTWILDAVSGEGQNVTKIHPVSYKVFLQIGYLMLVICYWPGKNNNLIIRSKNTYELTPKRAVLAEDSEGMAIFNSTSERFLFSIGARI